MNSMLTNDIDLPPSDGRVTISVEVLQNSEVEAHLLNGKIIVGQLKLLSYARKDLLIQSAEGPKLISFSQTLYLSFAKKIPVKPVKISDSEKASGKIASSPHQKYKIVLTNNESLNGEMVSVLIDGGGTHLFKIIDNKHVIRLFFPASSIASSRFGDQIGKALAEHKKIKPEVIDHALSLQNKQRKKKLGDYLVEAKVITAEALEQALEIQTRESLDNAENTPKRKIGEILVAEGALTQENLDQFVHTQQSNREKKIGEYLETMGVANTEDIQIELARKANLPFVKLASYKVEDKAIKLVSRKIAEKYQIMPLQIQDGRLLIAVDDPFNHETIDTLQFVTNKHLEMMVASTEDITTAINQNYDEEMIQGDISDAEDLQNYSLWMVSRRKLYFKVMESIQPAPLFDLLLNF